MKQTEQLLEYFQTQGNCITQLVAGKVLGIDRLASRVHDLKKAGYSFMKQTKKDMSGKRYTEYRFNGLLDRFA